MGKKPRSPRRRTNGDNKAATGDGDGDDWSRGRSVDQQVDDLSENHTINFNGNGRNGNGGDGGGTFASMEDDVDWDMDGDDDDGRQAGRNVDSAAAAEASHQARSVKLEDALKTCSDFSSEKQSSRRLGMLRRWFVALTQYATVPPYGAVEKCRDDLVIACGQSALLRGDATEQYAACRVVEALAVLLADPDLHERLYPRLVRVVQSTQRAPTVRAAALRALGMLTFCLQHNGYYYNDDDDDSVVTERTLDVCEMVVQDRYRNEPTPVALQAAAWQVWTLLATTLDELYVSGKDSTSTGRGLLLLPRLLEVMEADYSSKGGNNSSSSDLLLHEAAGQAVAYIHEARLKLGVHATLDGGTNSCCDGLNTTDMQFKVGSWEGSEWQDTIDELTQIMYDKAHASGHHLSKKAKKEQRQVFRDYLLLLQDNESPTEVVTFPGGSLELTCYKEIVPLEACRSCLQGGFQIQLLTNPTLQAMFGANGAALASHNPYSKLEKRLLLSKTSEAAKQKDQDRNKHRDKRRNVKNHFLTIDEDG